MEVIDCFYEVAFCSSSIYENVIKNALASHKFNNFSSRNSDYLQTVSVVFEDCWFYSSLVACNVLPQHGYWIWLCLSISFYILWNNCQPWSSIPIKIDCVWDQTYQLWKPNMIRQRVYLLPSTTTYSAPWETTVYQNRLEGL